ncbi:MAG TPA: class III extradiol ring-cleavage dioxygenase, partial [Syntrophorhabdaceae bacterium]|nr:class III extradiol ring-cleavage dioxygenase [Syntrophorhabdaceae bacterium]
MAEKRVYEAQTLPLTSPAKNRKRTVDIRNREASMLNQKDARNRAQIVYFSHGGGPLPILGDPSHKAMIDFMIKLPSRLARPDAILVISAHWEETEATLLSAPMPTMFYDYYGFPDEAYAITYRAPGSPDLATRIAAQLTENHIPTRLDPMRGFDHGLFIPLKLMYPQADIPCLQLSLVGGLNPAAHIALGRALRGLMRENILVIGSGFSFHNMGAFSWEGIDAPDPANEAFQNWLIEACTGRVGAEREALLIDWQRAPSARYCHPREEHLLPLHVCVGMADKRATKIFDDHILGKR